MDIENIPIMDEGEALGSDQEATENNNQPEYPPYVLQDEDNNEIAFYSMEEMSVTNTTSIPSEPIEEGSWASYNRVVEPLEATAILVMEGAEADIQTALDALNELARNEKKLTFITPFASYENMMLVSFDYRRDGNSGFNVLRVNINLKEIREVGSQKTTTAVTEPPPVTEQASPSDGSYVSDQTYGETPTQAPSSAEQDTADAGGTRRSVLAEMFGSRGSGSY